MPDAVHHVYARGNRRQTIFLDDDDRRTYLDLLGRSVREAGWRCLAYCLMDNHVHLLLRTPKPNLGSGVGALHSRYAQIFNRRHGLASHLFHRPFGSKRAPDGLTVMYFATYLALNPVRAGITERPERYRWSSHGAAVAAADRPAWLDDDGLLAYFGGDGRAARRRYATFVDAVRRLGAAGFDVHAASKLAAGVGPTPRRA